MSAVEAVVEEALTTFVINRGGPLDEVGKQWVADATTVIALALSAMQPEHLINFDGDGGWTIQHSMACRLEGDLFECPYTKVMVEGGEVDTYTGTYVAELTDDGRRIGLRHR